MSNNENNLTIEKALEQLEDIITRMDSNKLTLEASLSLYQEGVQLISYCREQLKQAQAKVEVLQSTKEGELKMSEIEDVWQ